MTKERIFKDKDGVEFKTSKAEEIAFIEVMEAEGIPWYTYSGRGMFGRNCPSVNVGGRNAEFHEEDVTYALGQAGKKIRLARDNMGLGMVLYTG